MESKESVGPPLNFLETGAACFQGVQMKLGRPFHRPICKSPRPLLISAILVCLVTQPLHAAKLKEQTAMAFDSYIAASHARMRAEIQNGPFLYIDGLPEERRREAYAQLREGQILVEQRHAKVEGNPIKVPGGLIHDWIGVIFIPHVSLAQTVAVAQDYDNYKKIYKPEVSRSRLVQRNGDNFKVFLQFYKKSLVTVVLNADYDIRYVRVGPDRMVSNSYSTRIVELKDAGQADEREFPVDDGHGYLWRLDSYWRLQAKDGGVYVQLESIGLSRGVPAIFAWLVNPLLQSIPRGSLTGLLGATRRYLAEHGQSAYNQSPSS